MPNRRVFCPLDGAVFSLQSARIPGKNCLSEAQNPSLPDTSPIFRQALAFWPFPAYQRVSGGEEMPEREGLVLRNENILYRAALACLGDPEEAALILG